jgi:HSP20 family protein
MRLLSYFENPIYNPVANHPRLLREMDQLFAAAFPTLSWSESAFPVDLYQDGDTAVIRAELPGFAKDELSVAAADGVLTVAARHPAKDDQDTERQMVREVRLPEFADSTRIEAVYENGVLTVRVPKREEARPVKITVN